jgi:hypothetical protein
MDTKKFVQNTIDRKKGKCISDKRKGQALFGNLSNNMQTEIFHTHNVHVTFHRKRFDVGTERWR